MQLSCMILVVMLKDCVCDQPPVAWCEGNDGPCSMRAGRCLCVVHPWAKIAVSRLCVKTIIMKINSLFVLNSGILNITVAYCRAHVGHIRDRQHLRLKHN